MFLRTPILTSALLALGCGGISVLTYSTIRGGRADRQNLRIGTALPIFVLFTAFANSEIVHFTPHLYDDLLLKTDFGVGAALRAWTLQHPGLPWIVGLCYEALPLAVVLAITYTSGSNRVRLLWSLCLAAVLAVPCYLLVPAVGPVHVGQPGAARNCMPSLHLTWAALLWIDARRGWRRGFFLVFIAITAFCTLATGEHYVVDLVAAIPYTWVAYRLSLLCANWSMAALARRSPAIAERNLAE